MDNKRSKKSNKSTKVEQKKQQSKQPKKAKTKQPIKHKHKKNKQNNTKHDMERVKKIKPEISTRNQNDIWNKYIAKFQFQPDNPSQLQSFTKTSSTCNTLSYKQCKIIYDTFSSNINRKTKTDKNKKFIERDMVAAKKRLSQRMNTQIINDTLLTEADENESTDETDSDDDDDQQIPHKKVTFQAPQIVFAKSVAFAPFTRPQTAKYMKYIKHSTFPRPETAKYGKQTPFSGCQRIHHSRHQSHSASLIKKNQKHDIVNVKQPPLSSYINQMARASSQKATFFHNYKITNKKRKGKHQKKDSLSSVVSELSCVNINTRQTPRFNHSFNNSILSNIDGPFSILRTIPQLIQESEEKQLFFSELVIDDKSDEEKDYMDQNTEFEENNENELNMIIEVPINAATEIFGNFLGALCGLCVPALDVISSLDAAETYELLSQYAATIDESGNAHTLLLYEQLDGVSLFHLKQQLQVAKISLNYSSHENNLNNSSTTTQERIQKYFVSVVRKTFGAQLPAHFSDDGRAMIRDAGFLFAVDMFLFNVSRFPVQLPFEGKENGNNLFISTDEDGDSVLYGLCNRFMGGHDIIDMPDYLVNGGVLNDDDQSIKLLLTKQRKYTNKYIGKLERFLSVLADYYQTKMLPKIHNMKQENDDVNKLVHGVATNQNMQNIVSNKMNSNQKLYNNITHKDCVDLCLRPIASYLYSHCGFELIIIDEYNNKNTNLDNDNEETILKVLFAYRQKLIDNMMTLLCEGILIGIEEISQQVQTNDIDTIIEDIKALDENMSGMQLISPQFLKVVLKLFHSASDLFELNIEDSSSDEDSDDD